MGLDVHTTSLRSWNGPLCEIRTDGPVGTIYGRVVPLWGSKTSFPPHVLGESAAGSTKTMTMSFDDLLA